MWAQWPRQNVGYQLAHRQSFSVFTTTHQPTRLWKNEERKRKEWRSRFDPVGNLSGSAKLVSEKRVGSGSVSRWQLWVGNYSHPFSAATPLVLWWRDYYMGFILELFKFWWILWMLRIVVEQQEEATDQSVTFVKIWTQMYIRIYSYQKN